MLREQVSQGTELGKQAKQIMDQGGLVSDEIIIGMVEQQLENNKECQNGFGTSLKISFQAHLSASGAP